MEPERVIYRILYNIIIKQPFVYNKLISFLFVNQLLPIIESKCQECPNKLSTNNTINGENANEDKSKDDNIDLLHLTLITILHDNCERIQMKSYIDLIENLYKYSLSTAATVVPPIDLERLFVNILAYFPMTTDDNIDLHRPKLFHLLNCTLMLINHKYGSDHYFNGINKWTIEKFPLIIVYLLKLLLNVWTISNLKQLICSIINCYVDKCNYNNKIDSCCINDNDKLDFKDKKLILKILRNFSPQNKINFRPYIFLMYINGIKVNKISYKDPDLLFMASIRHYSNWIDQKFATDEQNDDDDVFKPRNDRFHLKRFLQMLQNPMDNGLIYLTGNELKNLVDFLMKIYSPNECIIILCVGLFNIIHNYFQFYANNNSFQYFVKSMLDIVKNILSTMLSR